MQLKPLEYLGQSVQTTVIDGLGITLTRYADTEPQPWHYHEHLNISLLLAGTFLDESRELGQQMLGPLDLVVHPRGALHRSCPSGLGRISLNLEPLDGWFDKNGFKGVGYQVFSAPNLSLAAFQYLLGHESALADALLESLVGQSTKDETSHWYASVMDLVQQREDWSLSELARELGLHPVYLARVFRARTGTTVTGYLRNRRLTRAAQSLFSNRSANSEVAWRFGYADEAHFSRHFRSVFGMPPSIARKRFQIFN